MEDNENNQLPQIKNTAGVAIGICVVVLALIVLQHNLAFQNKGVIVLPAGGTYLGPTDTPTPTVPALTITPMTSGEPAGKPAADGSYTTTTGKFGVTKNAPWVTVYGHQYPYSFKAPKALQLVAIPNNAYDIYAIAWNNQSPDQNVLIGVDNMNNSDSLKQYITTSKRGYVENWWKQFGGLKGVASITEFTNSAGLKGYRAKYFNSANQTPNDDVFFETPNPQYVIHLASGVLDASVFDPLIDSVSWKK